MGKKMKFVLIKRTKTGQTTTRFATRPKAKEEALKWIQYREGIEGGVLSMRSTTQVLPIGEYNRQEKTRMAMTELQKKASIRLIGRLPRSKKELKELKIYVKSPVGDWLRKERGISQKKRRK